MASPEKEDNSFVILKNKFQIFEEKKKTIPSAIHECHFIIILFDLVIMVISAPTSTWLDSFEKPRASVVYYTFNWAYTRVGTSSQIGSMGTIMASDNVGWH